MAAEAAHVHTWRVGRWTVTLSMPPIAPGVIHNAVCEWDPAMPSRPLTASEQQQYQQGLQQAIRAIAAKAAVVDR